MAVSDSRQPVTLAEYLTVQEALFLRLNLEEAGIACVVSRLNANWNDSSSFIAARGVGVEVAAADLEPAAKIVRKINRSSANPRDGRERCLACQGELAADATQCPQCGWTWNSVSKDLESATEESP